MKFDFHTHCFPDRIAENAIKKVGHAAGDLLPYSDGTLTGLKQHMQEQGVDGFVALNIATNPRKMRSINDFAAQISASGDCCFGFGSIHPDAPDALEELDYIKSIGLKGVKLHPDYQQFFVDDEKMRPIYQKISKLGLITVFHAGQDYGYPYPYHAMPKAMCRALQWFDGAPVVAAHWGGLDCGPEVVALLCGLPLYFDTSMGYSMMPRPTAERILEKHGVDRMLLGSDSPWHTPQMELRFLNSLGLSDTELDRICYRNAASLLGISTEQEMQEI
ncbi:MAG: amidohydrolase family protein [Oscillospiraceae bacterium]